MLKSAGITLFFLLLQPAVISAPDQSLIVFPLDGPAKGSPLQWLSEGIAISLSNQLDSRELKAMERSERVKLVESLDLPPGARLSRASMIRVAQRADADLVIMGVYSGTEQNLKISVRALNVKTLKLSGEMAANGPLSNLPQLENELAWMILNNNSFGRTLSRVKFQEKMRKVPNPAYASYIQSLEASDENDQLHLLLKAVGGYRDFPEAQFQLGRAYFQKGDCGSAIPHLLLGKNEASTQVENDFMRGTCYLQGDQPSLAIQSFVRLLQVSRPFEALNNLGVAYLRKGDISPAVNALTEARSQAHSDPTVSLNLAIARHVQGNDLAARAVLEEACRSHPKNGMLQFLMGVMLMAQGDNEKAAEASAKAKSLGLNVAKLQTDDPKTWSRVLSKFESR